MTEIFTDYIRGWLWRIKEDAIIPPFCVEIFLNNGKSYYLQSVHSKDDNTKSMVARIWDLREFNSDDIETLKEKLNNINSRSELLNSSEIHKKLDWANLRIYLKDISYCIEWHDKFWSVDLVDEKTIHGFSDNYLNS